MAIKIKQQGSAYSISLDEEQWTFTNRKEMEAALKIMLDWKDKYGRIKDRN